MIKSRGSIFIYEESSLSSYIKTGIAKGGTPLPSRGVLS
jgi:hypothetical protein